MYSKSPSDTPLAITKVVILALVFLSVQACSRKSSSHVSKRPSLQQSDSRVVNDARRLLNSKYRYGGNSPKGFDCSGFVHYVYRQQGVNLPRQASDQSKQGKKIDISSAQPGDLVFFRSGGRITHVGIVSDTRGKYPSMIHASSSSGVIETDIDEVDYWRKRLAFVKRI